MSSLGDRLKRATTDDADSVPAERSRTRLAPQWGHTQARRPWPSRWCSAHLPPGRRPCTLRPGAAQPRRRPRTPASASARPWSTGGQQDRFAELKTAVHTELLKQLGPQLYETDVDLEELAAKVRQTLKEALSAQDRPLSAADRNQVTKEITDDILGYGPIEPFLNDPEVTEVMVNGFDQIYVEKKGRLTAVNAHFADELHLRRTVDKIVSRIGRRVDESSPMVDARLPDGSRVNAVIPPLAIDGSCLTIRKFSADPLTADDLIAFGSMSQRTAGLPRGLRPRPAEHRRLGIDRRRQDHHPQRALVVHPDRRADRDHRGRRRAPAAPGPRGPPRVPPVQHRGQGRGLDPRPGQEQPAHATRPHHRR